LGKEVEAGVREFIVNVAGRIMNPNPQKVGWVVHGLAVKAEEKGSGP
jgi:hypothetical protein